MLLLFFFSREIHLSEIFISWNTVKKPESYSSVLYIHCTEAKICIFLVIEITKLNPHMTDWQNASFIIALVFSRSLTVECRYVLRPPCIWYDANIGEKRKKSWFSPKQVTSWVQREMVNVSRHTDVLGGARHRNYTGEPGFDIALHIVVKFCSLGLGGVLLVTFCWNLFAEISK